MTPVKKACVLAIPSVLAGLLLCEGFLWLSGQPRFSQPRHTLPELEVVKLGPSRWLHTLPPNEPFRLVYEGNPDGYFDAKRGVTHTVNASGFRGDDFMPEKPSGTTRIAFLGDSFTFGEGVKDGDTYAARTERLLNDRFAKAGRRFESRNYGMMGYNTPQEHLLLEHVVLPHDPDIVVLTYTLNDAEPEIFSEDPTGEYLVPRPLAAAMNFRAADAAPPETGWYRLRLARLLWKIRAARKRTREMVEYYRGLYDPGNASWLKTQAALHEIQRLCRQRNLPLLVVVFPVFVEGDGGYPFAAIHRQVCELITADARTACLDLQPLFQGRKASSFWVHPSDQHPNHRAHRIAAEAITEWIAERAGAQGP